MADTFALSGTWTTTPGGVAVSGAPAFVAPLATTMTLAFKQTTTYELTADNVQTVDFGGLTEADIVVITTVGGKVRVRYTSDDGDEQAVPVEGILVLQNSTVPITAIDLLRAPGVTVTVYVFLGQEA